MAMKTMHDLNVLPRASGLTGTTEYRAPKSVGLYQKNRSFRSAEMVLTRSSSARGNFAYSNRGEGAQATSIPLRLQNPLLRSATTCRTSPVVSPSAGLRLTKSCSKLTDLRNLKHLIDDSNVVGRSTPMDASSNMLLRALLSQEVGSEVREASSLRVAPTNEITKVCADAEAVEKPEETEASESSASTDNLEIPIPIEMQRPGNEEMTEASAFAETKAPHQNPMKPKRTTEIQDLSDGEETGVKATPRRIGSRRNLMAPKRARSLRNLITPTSKEVENTSDSEETKGRAAPRRRGSRRNLLAPKRASSFRNLITPSPKETQNLSDGEETEGKAAPKRSSSRRNLMAMRASSFRNLITPTQKESQNTTDDVNETRRGVASKEVEDTSGDEAESKAAPKRSSSRRNLMAMRKHSFRNLMTTNQKEPQNPPDEVKDGEGKMASTEMQDTSSSETEARPSPKRKGSRRNLLSMRRNSFRNLITPELQDSTDDEKDTEGKVASKEMQDTSSDETEARPAPTRKGSRRNLMSMRRHSFRNLMAPKPLQDSSDEEKDTEGKIDTKEMQDTSTNKTDGRSAPKRTGSRRNLLSMRSHSFRHLMAPNQKELQYGADDSSEAEEGRMPPKRSSSGTMLRNPLAQNGRSGTFPPASGRLKTTRSCAKLEDMRSALTRTSSCGRNLSSHALQALSKISNKQNQEEQEFEQDPVFFSMIQYNPMDAEERAKYDDSAVKKYIRKNPEALKAKYDFQVGGRGRLTVSRYPLSALVALGASLSVVKLAIKANPSALEASKDFHSTALHTACSFDTNIEILQYIYNKHPRAIAETTKLVYLPLHNACQASTMECPMVEVIRFLVDEHPEGLMAINKLGDTPLRMAQRKGSMPKEVLDFLEVETERIFSLEENSETFSYICERQSWGSGNKELGEGVIEKVMLSMDQDESVDGQSPQLFSDTAA